MALDSETLDQLLDSVVRFVRDRLVPLEHKIAEDDAIPADVKQDIRDMGLFGLSIPQEYGGLGLDMAEALAEASVDAERRFTERTGAAATRMPFR